MNGILRKTVKLIFGQLRPVAEKRFFGGVHLVETYGRHPYVGVLKKMLDVQSAL